MKQIMTAAGLCILLWLFPAVSTAQRLEWKQIRVDLPRGWQVSPGTSASSRLVLASDRNGVQTLLKLSVKPLTKKPVTDYKAWLDRYSSQWASYHFSNPGIQINGPVSVYGNDSCPMAFGQNKSTSVYQFLPLVEGRIYAAVVNIEPWPGGGLPDYVADILTRISFKGHGGGGADRPAASAPSQAGTPGPVQTAPEKRPQPAPDLNDQFSDADLAALDNRVDSVTAMCEKGDRQGLTALLMKDTLPVMKPALDNCSPEELARFGRALKTRKAVAVGDGLVEYEITDGERTYAVSFINFDGEWFLYHF